MAETIPMTTPHPAPEERYEAARQRGFDRYRKSPVHSDYPHLYVREEMIAAIREAEAAAEARGRAMERAECAVIARDAWHSDEWEKLAKPEAAHALLCKIAQDTIRARTDKENSDV